MSSSLIFLIFLFSRWMISNGVDTITTTQFLTANNSIVSSGGTFELGFYSPDNSRTSWFLGIWYKKITAKTVVWTANRETPLNDTPGAVLKMDGNGVLSLLSNTNSTIWFAKSSRSTLNPVARLLETGNLVLQGANDDEFLWQSFDHPTDTFMPTMKLGTNFVTGVTRFLSNGNHTFVLDTHGYPQLFIKNASAAFFRTGPWNGLRFSSSPGLRPNNIYAYSFFLRQEETYYTYWLLNPSNYTRMELNPNGVVHRYVWNYGTEKWDVIATLPEDECDIYGVCGAYGTCSIVEQTRVCRCFDKFVPKLKKDWDRADWSGGCVRTTPLNCKDGDDFLKYSGVKIPDTKNSSYNISLDLDECRAECLKNCNCTAYAQLDITKSASEPSGCLLWFEDLMDIKMFTDGGQDIYIRLASSELGSGVHSDNKEDKKTMRIGLVLIPVAFLVGLGLILIYLYLKKKKKKKKKAKTLQLEREQQQQQQQQRESRTNTEDLELPLFNVATIAEATNNFAEKNKVGEGGFGSVYKGMLEEGQEIAVKRLSQYSAQGLDEFMNEVVCIAKLQHRNLVKLLGCCVEGEEKMLIYEYLPNNSLDSFIFDQTQKELLDWPKRFNIINGTARGLLYLHEDSRLRIVHRDLKVANILLDIDMNPKISDFGMARIFGGNETAANTKRVVGTYGYMSPEYAVDGLFSVKSDVFSFGVIVLETLSGRLNRGFHHPDHHHNLLGHAWLLHQENRSLELIDVNVDMPCHLPELLRLIHVGLLCVQQDPEDRPSMSLVVQMLGGEGALPQPKEPGFFTNRNLFYEASCSSENNAQLSANEISISLLEAR